MVTVVVNNQELEFPDNMSPEEIKVVLRQKFPTTKKPELAAGLIGKLGQGATLGLADELQAGLFAPTTYIANKIRGQKDATLGGAYDQLLQEQRANLQTAGQQYPIVSTVAELAGGLGTLGGIGAGTKFGRAVYSAGAKGLAPTAITKLGKAANLASRIGIGAGTGAATTGAYGFGSGEGGAGKRLDEAKSVAILGASVGGGLPLATTGLGAVGLALTPKIDEGFKEVGKLARKYNIPLSLDQLTSSRTLKTAQKVSQDLPFSGQSNFQDLQRTRWQSEVIRTFGEEGERFTPELADKAFARLGEQFNALGKGKVVPVGNFANNVSKNVIESGKELGAAPQAIEGVQAYIKRSILPMIKKGDIEGEALNKIRAEVNELARNTPNLDSAMLYRDLENEIIDALTEGSGKAAEAFTKTKFQYKNLLAAEPLFTKGQGGVVNPTLLNDRVKKIYGRAYTKGQAGDLGELARVGRELLPALGGSDTFAKSAYGLGALTGGGAVAGASGTFLPAAATVGVTLAGNRAFQSFFNRNQKLIDRLLKGDAKAVKEVTKLKPEEAMMVFEGVNQLKAGIK